MYTSYPPSASQRRPGASSPSPSSAGPSNPYHNHHQQQQHQQPQQPQYTHPTPMHTTYPDSLANASSSYPYSQSGPSYSTQYHNNSWGSFPSSSTTSTLAPGTDQQQQQSQGGNNGTASFEPSPHLMPLPPPLPFENILSDSALASLPLRGPFAPLVDGGLETPMNENTFVPWSLNNWGVSSGFFDSFELFQPPPITHSHANNHGSSANPTIQTPQTDRSTPLGDDAAPPLPPSSSTMGYIDHYFPPAPLLDYREPVSMSLQDPSDPPLVGYVVGGSGSGGKGKEKAGGEGMFAGDSGAAARMDLQQQQHQPLSAGSTVERFDRDVASLKNHLAELIGLLQPFTKSPDRPNPPTPPPYLHTRFLRLATSIQQSLVRLAPFAQPYLSAESSRHPALSKLHQQATGQSSPRRSKFDKPPVPVAISSNAEKEMELIRKRRDWLIAKAAQAKLNTASINSLAAPISLADASRSNGHGLAASTPGLPGHNLSISASQSPSTAHLLPPPTSSTSLPHLGPAPGLSGGGGGAHLDPRPYGLDNGIDRRGPGAGKTADNPSGRCHGCGDQFTMEWRRGPDGAKTLCDSCGLHYAKLSRRKESQSPAPPSMAQAPSVLG